MCHPGTHSWNERTAMAERDRHEMQIILNVYPYTKLKRFYQAVEDVRQAPGSREHGKKIIHMIE